MDFKSISLLVFSVAWIFLCQKWYCCWMQEACLECSNEPRNSFPIGFTQGNAFPDTTFRFQVLVNTIKGERKPDHYLEISGRYLTDEKAHLGFSRAENTQELFKSIFPTDSISLRSQQSFASEFNKTPYAPMVDLQWVPIPRMEFPKQMTIPFQRSTAKIKLTQVQYSELAYLCKYAKKNDLKILVTGHSDASGDDRTNKKYGLRRARKIEEIVQQFGIDSEQLILKSFGSEKPIDLVNPSNNRRVEISIIK